MGASGEQCALACVVDRGAVRVEVIGEQDHRTQDVGAVRVAGEGGEERGQVVTADGGAGQADRDADRGGVPGQQTGDSEEFVGALGGGPAAGVPWSEPQRPLRPQAGRQQAGPGVVVGWGPDGVDTGR